MLRLELRERAGVAEWRVAAVFAEQGVIAEAAEDQVVALTASQEILARAAIDEVVPELPGYAKAACGSSRSGLRAREFRRRGGSPRAATARR